MSNKPMCPYYYAKGINGCDKAGRKLKRGYVYFRNHPCPKKTNSRCEIINRKKKTTSEICTCGFEKFFHNFSNRLHIVLKPAVKRWQKENNCPNTWPDTISLVSWILRRKDITPRRGL